MADVRERILRLSAPAPGGCREWRGARFPNGYGRITVGSPRDGTRVVRGAHRAAFEAFVGPVPPGLCVLHSCDNRACVEPAHLFVGTDADNARDRVAKGRSGRCRGSANARARLSETEVMAVRWLVAEGVRQRIVAAHFGVEPHTVSRICRGRRWAHLPVLPFSPQRGGRR